MVVHIDVYSPVSLISQVCEGIFGIYFQVCWWEWFFFCIFFLTYIFVDLIVVICFFSWILGPNALIIIIKLHLLPFSPFFLKKLCYQEEAELEEDETSDIDSGEESDDASEVSTFVALTARKLFIFRHFPLTLPFLLTESERSWGCHSDWKPQSG